MGADDSSGTSRPTTTDSKVHSAHHWPRDVEAPMSEKLKPCPFCGTKEGAELSLVVDSMFGTRRAHCWNCGASGPAKRQEENAIAAWNRRVEVPDE